MSGKQESKLPDNVRKAVDAEVFIFIFLFLSFFCACGMKMGTANMFNTMMNTAYALLMDTVFYIMAIAVLAGAVSALFSEFGVISLLNKVLSLLIHPIYGLPGVQGVVQSSSP